MSISSTDLQLTAEVAVIIVVAIVLVLSINEWRNRWRFSDQQLRKELSLPPGKIIYIDADGSSEPLQAKSFPLNGKPDYVVMSPEGKPIPLELKLHVTGERAFSNHLMQIGAYLVILEDIYGVAPEYGILRYYDHEFKVEYTPALKRKVLSKLDAVLECVDTEDEPFLERQAVGKCKACAYKPECPIGRKN